jgi:hypothetical protein
MIPDGAVTSLDEMNRSILRGHKHLFIREYYIRPVSVKAALHQGNNWQHVSFNMLPSVATKVGLHQGNNWQQLTTCCLQHVAFNMLPSVATVSCDRATKIACCRL